MNLVSAQSSLGGDFELVELRDPDTFPLEEIRRIKGLHLVENYALDCSTREGESVFFRLEGRVIQVLGVGQDQMNHELKMALGMDLDKTPLSPFLSNLFSKIEESLRKDLKEIDSLDPGILVESDENPFGDLDSFSEEESQCDVIQNLRKNLFSKLKIKMLFKLQNKLLPEIFQELSSRCKEGELKAMYEAELVKILSPQFSKALLDKVNYSLIKPPFKHVLDVKGDLELKWKKELRLELDHTLARELEKALAFQLKKIRAALIAKREVRRLSKNFSKSREERTLFIERLSQADKRSLITDQDKQKLQSLEEALDFQLESSRRALVQPAVENETLFRVIDQVAPETCEKIKGDIRPFLFEICTPLQSIRFFFPEEIREQILNLTPILWRLSKESVVKLHLYLQYKRIDIGYQHNKEFNDKIAEETKDLDLPDLRAWVKESVVRDKEKLDRYVEEFQEGKDYFFNEEKVLDLVLMMKRRLDPWPKIELVKQAARQFLFPSKDEEDDLILQEPIFELSPSPADDDEKEYLAVLEKNEKEYLAVLEKTRAEQDEKLRQLSEGDDVFSNYARALLAQDSPFCETERVMPSGLWKGTPEDEFARACAKFGVQVLVHPDTGQSISRIFTEDE